MELYSETKFVGEKQSNILESSIFEPLEVAIVGIGRWGKVIVKEMESLLLIGYIKKIHIVAGSNYDDINNNYIKDENKIIYEKQQLKQILNNSKISCVIISTQFEKHYDLVKLALESHKNVLVEKPFVPNLDEAKELRLLAQIKDCILMVGYEYMYDERFKLIKKIIQKGNLGQISDVYINLINRKKNTKNSFELTIVENIVTHQLSIIQKLFGNQQMKDLKISIMSENYIKLSFKYGNINIKLDSAVNYLENTTIRDIKVTGSEKLLYMDYFEKDLNLNVEYVKTHEKIRLIESGNVQTVRDNDKTPLQSELYCFLDSCIKREEPISGGNHSLHLMELTEIINKQYKIQLEEFRTSKELKEKRVNKELSNLLFSVIDKSNDNIQKVNNFTERTRKVIDYLSEKPYSSAREICDSINVTKEEIKLIYKTIQNSNEAYNLLRESDNFDYFNSIEFLNGGGMEITFFVGLSCPYKCFFCQSVSIDGNGKRKTNMYPYKANELISFEAISETLDYLKMKSNSGGKVAVKISGGLEPLSDIQRVDYIIREANKRQIPTKVFTNGFLLSEPTNRKTVLDATDIRISLNAINSIEYSEFYGRDKSDFYKLKQNIIKLTKENKETCSPTKIGIKSVIVESNVNQMVTLVKQAIELGCDFIDFSSDFNQDSNEKFSFIAKQQKYEIEIMLQDKKLNYFKTTFGGALFSNNSYSEKPKGKYLPNEQIDYKLFIDPAGKVVPLHYWAFPKEVKIYNTKNQNCSLGKIDINNNIEDIINRENRSLLNEVDYNLLNPFEFILALEFRRRKLDEEYGIDVQNSPYPYLLKNVH
ncbi:Gfo/Idh/MocA family oxidoreductase [Clostridium estertheticum]|uniref:Gfo/Idh/MocA family oxidoreductase n=1 Tax=Clostridium estertheticum TaxID=238834 RepID=UPI001C0C74B0|nr:Gfo/Idh/MocA family oxidoreductase [Clostridium estertheticum]MBU3175914.1 Gfo/Idh/MocA family oxidoreductase [Clostridium estertheticum]